MMKRVALAWALVWLAACASSPRRPSGTDELVFPTVRPGELSAEEVRRLRDGWDRLLAGETEGAVRELERLRAQRPSSRAATRRATVLFPAPAGPSMAICFAIAIGSSLPVIKRENR